MSVRAKMTIAIALVVFLAAGLGVAIFITGRSEEAARRRSRQAREL
jgi:flagellar basal body-associated protein FliL